MKSRPFVGTRGPEYLVDRDGGVWVAAGGPTGEPDERVWLALLRAMAQGVGQVMGAMVVSTLVGAAIAAALGVVAGLVMALGVFVLLRTF